MGKTLDDLPPAELQQLDLAIADAIGRGQVYVTQDHGSFARYVREEVHRKGPVLVNTEAFRLSCKVKAFSQYLVASRIQQLLHGKQ